jgi:hypothetical protein
VAENRGILTHWTITLICGLAISMTTLQRLPWRPKSSECCHRSVFVFVGRVEDGPIAGVCGCVIRHRSCGARRRSQEGPSGDPTLPRTKLTAAYLHANEWSANNGKEIKENGRLVEEQAAAPGGLSLASWTPFSFMSETNCANFPFSQWLLLLTPFSPHGQVVNVGTSANYVLTVRRDEVTCRTLNPATGPS